MAKYLSQTLQILGSRIRDGQLQLDTFATLEALTLLLNLDWRRGSEVEITKHARRRTKSQQEGL